MMHSSQIPSIVRNYFNSSEVDLVETFIPERGWIKPYNKRVSLNKMRSLADLGVTVFAFEHNGRRADFNAKEILRTHA